VLRALCRFETAQRACLQLSPLQRIERCNVDSAARFAKYMSTMGSRDMRAALSRMLMAVAERDPISWFLATRVPVSGGSVLIARTLAKAIKATCASVPVWGFAAPVFNPVVRKRLAEAVARAPSAKRFRLMLQDSGEARAAVGRLAAAFPPHCRHLTVQRLRRGPPCWTAMCDGGCGWLMSGASPNQPAGTVNVDTGAIACGGCGGGTSPIDAGAAILRDGGRWLTGCTRCGALSDKWSVVELDVVCAKCSA
jgi:hypothetical protein